MSETMPQANPRTDILGRGFLGMLVIRCPRCSTAVHMKPIFGLLHVCK